MSTKISQLPQIKVKGVPILTEKLQYETIYDRKLDLTFDRACKFLEMDTFEGERQVNENHVQTLFKAHCNGEFIWEHVEIGTCRVKSIPDKVFRVNGQHTSWLRISLGEKYSDPCMVREVLYEVKDERDLRRLYCTFDQNKPRTAGHSFRALITGSRMATDIAISQANKLAAGFRLWLYEYGSIPFRTATAGDLAAIAMDKHPALFSTVGIFMRPAVVSQYVPMKRAACIAALFATFDVNVEKAGDFWMPICSGLGLQTKNDPRYQLKRFLETHGHNAKTGGDILISSEDLYRICIQAWNHWRKGNPVERLITTNKRYKAI